MKTIVYDVEIINVPDETEKGWDDPFGLGFASAVIYYVEDDRYDFFLHEESKSRLIETLNGNRTISFNGIGFDTMNILGNDRVIKPTESPLSFHVEKEIDDKIVSWREFDIFMLAKRSEFGKDDVMSAFLSNERTEPGVLKLMTISKMTLGGNYFKTGESALAPKLYQNKDYANLLQYNLQDVRLTYKLYDFIMKNGYIMNGRDEQLWIKK